MRNGKNCISLVDDQGAFATLKENLRFSEPCWVLVPNLQTKKHAPACFCLVDDQGLEPWAH